MWSGPFAPDAIAVTRSIAPGVTEYAFTVEAANCSIEMGENRARPVTIASGIKLGKSWNGCKPFTTAFVGAAMEGQTKGFHEDRLAGTSIGGSAEENRE